MENGIEKNYVEKITKLEKSRDIFGTLFDCSVVFSVLYGTHLLGSNLLCNIPMTGIKAAIIGMGSLSTLASAVGRGIVNDSIADNAENLVREMKK